jgi:hypothetical protein
MSLGLRFIPNFKQSLCTPECLKEYGSVHNRHLHKCNGFPSISYSIRGSTLGALDDQDFKVTITSYKTYLEFKASFDRFFHLIVIPNISKVTPQLRSVIEENYDPGTSELLVYGSDPPDTIIPRVIDAFLP